MPDRSDGQCVHHPRPRPAGWATRHVMVDNIQREYRVYIPSDYAGGAHGFPLVIGAPGTKQTAASFIESSGFADSAEAYSSVVVVIQGLNDQLNVEADATANPEPNDVSYASAMLDVLSQELCIDKLRIHATGMSRGGRFASRLASELSHRIASIAPVSGLRFPIPNHAGRPVPVLAIHGLADTTDPFEGGGPHYWRTGVPEAIEQWARFNGCANATRRAFGEQGTFGPEVGDLHAISVKQQSHHARRSGEGEDDELPGKDTDGDGFADPASAIVFTDTTAETPAPSTAAAAKPVAVGSGAGVAPTAAAAVGAEVSVGGGGGGAPLGWGTTLTGLTCEGGMAGDGCATGENADVRLYTLRDLGHHWPVAAWASTVDVAAVMFNFFEDHPMPVKKPRDSIGAQRGRGAHAALAAAAAQATDGMTARARFQAATSLHVEADGGDGGGAILAVVLVLLLLLLAGLAVFWFVLRKTSSKKGGSSGKRSSDAGGTPGSSAKGGNGKNKRLSKSSSRGGTPSTLSPSRIGGSGGYARLMEEGNGAADGYNNGGDGVSDLEQAKPPIKSSFRK
ncbi:Alpha/Beta hydrolase protein [Pavlovales sp. CCMP2436]|nr:Alpha/Beta hydrolase protein [Pavlovales sp. CCMP2436]